MCELENIIGIGGIFRLGLSVAFSNLGFLGQIASSGRCLRGAARTPLVLRYPFRTWRRTRTGAGQYFLFLALLSKFLWMLIYEVSEKKIHRYIF